MTFPDINIWAVVIATVATVVVGSVWYARRVFGNYWMRVAGVDPAAANAVGPMLLMPVVAFVTALVLAGSISIAHDFYGGTFLSSALITGVLLWAGFTAARVVSHDAFDKRPRGLTALTLAYELVSVLVMSLIIGLMGV